MSTKDNIPALLLEDKTQRGWEQRKDSLLSLFATEVYGKTPDKSQYSVDFIEKSSHLLWDDVATQKTIKVIITTTYDTFSFPFTLVIPNNKKPCPAIVFINNRPPSLMDPTKENEFWPIREIIDTGFASAVFHTESLSPDADVNFKGGIIPSFYEDLNQRKPHDWATIGAWAFGASRVLDYLLSHPNIQGDNVAVVGHSRGGKTALWAAAQDPRFWSAYSNNSGSTGAAISRGKEGETIQDINTGFPFWFCDNYKKYNGKEELLPVDQHMLLALCAPRPIYVASATTDTWADPTSEYLSTLLADEVYHLYHDFSLRPSALPPPDTPDFSGPIGYHLRTGDHDLTLWDWQQYLSFLKKYL